MFKKHGGDSYDLHTFLSWHHCRLRRVAMSSDISHEAIAIRLVLSRGVKSSGRHHSSSQVACTVFQHPGNTVGRPFALPLRTCSCAAGKLYMSAVPPMLLVQYTSGTACQRHRGRLLSLETPILGGEYYASSSFIESNVTTVRLAFCRNPSAETVNTVTAKLYSLAIIYTYFKLILLAVCQ